MLRSIELIVGNYAKLGDRQSLEKLRSHRQVLLEGLRSRSGFDCSFIISELDGEIAAIESGLAMLETSNNDQTIQIRREPEPEHPTTRDRISTFFTDDSALDFSMMRGR